LTFILVVNLSVGLYGLHLYRHAAEREKEVLETTSRIVSLVLSAQVHFKKQVQEWKDVLLRGQDDALYAKYLGQFEAEEQSTRDAMQRLLPMLADSPEAQALAQRFLDAHVRLGSEYRTALELYDPASPNPQLVVDRTVRGIDRQPTDLLDQVVDIVRGLKGSKLRDIGGEARAVERRIAFFVIALMTGAVLLMLWLLDRTVAQPIATATAVARRIRAGDLASPIRPTGSDEAAQMLSALEAMQTSLRDSRDGLRRSEAKTRLLLESSGEGIYGVDTEGRCTFCNPAAARMLGYASTDALIGAEMHSRMHHSHADGSPLTREHCAASRTYIDGTPAHVDDEVFWRADGTSLPVEYYSHPVLMDGALVGAVVNFSDVSERKQSEAALVAAHDALSKERALLAERVRERTAELDLANAELERIAQAKDEFLAAMSHELRTPLTSILGLAETLGEGVLGSLTDAQKKAARTICTSGTHLLALINDILDVAKIAAGQMSLAMDQIPVHQLWDAGLRLVRQSAEQKNLRVSAQIDPSVRLIQGDSRRLKQILVNLLSNAVKFTPEGGAIGLEVVGDRERREVKISVWDTGIGIAPEQQEHLFKPFLQFESGLTRDHQGSGLGLALVHGMVESHGGSIRVHSVVGRGSRFEVVLPWDPAQTADVRPQESEETAQDNALRPFVSGRARILLAENDEDSRQMFSDYLSRKGFDVVTACDGADALVKGLAQRPDLILMDVHMPEMDGLEATRRLRAEPGLRRVPIIALTALAMPGDRQRCLDAGMDDYLSKPLGMQELHRTLLGWLRRRSAA
jgi:PAS domain S-box-containing protein